VSLHDDGPDGTTVALKADGQPVVLPLNVQAVASWLDMQQQREQA
jgi:hypothetical protein